MTSSTVVLEATVMGSRVMTRSIGVVFGSRPPATTRERTSRSVKMPAIRPLSITRIAPTRCRSISFAAAATVIAGDTENTVEPLRSNKTEIEVFMR